MADYIVAEKALRELRRSALLAALFWTLLLVGSFLWFIHHAREQSVALAKKEAEATINKDLSFRYWATKHGGVYVPATDETPPNPYLSNIPDRDITLPSGKPLTLMNPAYMMRQTMQQYADIYGTKGHLTSLKLMNPMNKPDDWERKALEEFEKGVKEVSEVTELDGKSYLCLMRPTFTAKGCLKCHAAQGYKEGDIRGGLRASVPMDPYFVIGKESMNKFFISHSVIGIIGLVGIGLFFRQNRISILRQEESRNKERIHGKFLEDIIESLTHPFYVIDANDYSIPLSNSAATRNFASGKNTCYAKTRGRDVPCSGSAHICPLDEIKRTKKPIKVEHINRDEQGNEKYIEVHAYPILDAEGNVLQMIEYTFDITERKNADAALLKLSEELENRVMNRTKELEEKNEELERLNKLFVGRELRMIELKQKLAALEKLPDDDTGGKSVT
ncbi:MAG: DUF3365 domain-containing protein [Candidatus Riflebacteria bacterium]|nr:DUF3365 domain-containing protein [Candidatus Riflebacteria bacterium]